MLQTRMWVFKKSRKYLIFKSLRFIKHHEVIFNKKNKLIDKFVFHDMLCKEIKLNHVIMATIFSQNLFDIAFIF